MVKGKCQQKKRAKKKTNGKGDANKDLTTRATSQKQKESASINPTLTAFSSVVLVNCLDVYVVSASLNLEMRAVKNVQTGKKFCT